MRVGVSKAMNAAIEQARQREEIEREARYAGEGGPIGGGGGDRRRAKIKELGNNYVRVRTWDGTTEGSEDIYVAKPWKHRHVLANYPWLSSFTTVDTNTAYVSDGTHAVQIKMTQPYLVGDEVWIVPAGAGGSGLNDPDGSPITYMVEDEGRDWAVV